MSVSPHTYEVGQSELSAKGGFERYSEGNAKLRAEKGFGTLSKQGQYEEMLQTNPIVAVGFLSMVATLQNVNYQIDDRGGRVRKRVAKYAHDLCFERMESRFQQPVETALLALAYGFSPHEITTYIDGGLTWIKNLSPRHPRTFGWDYSKVWRDGDGYFHAQQRFLNNKGLPSTAHYGSPGEHGKGWLWWPRYGHEIFGGNSVLRASWSEHCEKAGIRTSRKVAEQKDLFPTPLLHERDGSNPSADAIEKTSKNLGKIVYCDEGIGFLPSWVDKITKLSPADNAIENSIKAENHADVQIFLSFASQWMARGLMAAYGSNAASRTDTAEQRNLRKYFLDWLCAQFQPLLDWFVEYNFGPQVYYPQLIAGYREELTLIEEVRDAVMLQKAGILWPDEALRAYFRAAHGWPVEGPDAAPAVAAAESLPDTEGDYDDDTGDDTRDRPSDGDYT